MVGIVSAAQIGLRSRRDTARKRFGAALPINADPNVRAASSHLFSVAKRSSLRGVTVYEPQKTAVYRQKYRHQTVDSARFSDTTIDTQRAKN